MSENFTDDRPMFPVGDSKTDDTNQAILNKNSSSLAVTELEADIKRKDKILSFSFILMKYFLMACGALVIVDVIFKKIGVEDSLASEFFDLMKYSITSVLGYLFASEHKK